MRDSAIPSSTESVPRYARYIGIDYSGASSCRSGLSGLQVCLADADTCGIVFPSQTLGTRPRTVRWSREKLAAWLHDQVSAAADSQTPLLIGIDHGLSFPLSYFQRLRLMSWDACLQDFAAHWPTDEPDTTVDDIRRRRKRLAGRSGKAHEKRLTERWTVGAKSVFHFDVQGSVAKSTHAGLPWIWRLRRAYPTELHFWPFDGWENPQRRSLLAEVYPSLVRQRFPLDARTPDQRDAMAIAIWLRDIDQRGVLDRYLQPPLNAADRAVAEMEGWILGVT